MSSNAYSFRIVYGFDLLMVPQMSPLYVHVVTHVVIFSVIKYILLFDAIHCCGFAGYLQSSRIRKNWAQIPATLRNYSGMHGISISRS